MSAVLTDTWRYSELYDEITVTYDPARAWLSWETLVNDNGRMSAERVEQSAEDFLRWGPPDRSRPWLELPVPAGVAGAIGARLGGPAPAWLQEVTGPARWLLSAAQDGDLARIQAALGKGAPVDATDGFGNTAFTLAIEAGRAPAALGLLEAGARLTSVYAFRGAPRSALRLAVERRLASVAAALLGRGLSPEEPDEGGRTLLMSVPHGVGCEETVAALLAAGADPRALDPHGRTTLHHLVASGAAAPAAARLLSRGVRADAGDELGQTPLMLASGVDRGRSRRAHPSIETARLLLASGAPVDAVDRNGDAALTWAGRIPQPAMIKLLLDHGADPRRAAPDGARRGVAAPASGRGDPLAPPRGG